MTNICFKKKSINEFRQKLKRRHCNQPNFYIQNHKTLRINLKSELTFLLKMYVSLLTFDFFIDCSDGCHRCQTEEVKFKLHSEEKWRLLDKATFEIFEINFRNSDSMELILN